ncbi:CDK2-associated and cullin domain-containing protein 1 [Chytridiales sp. JEL 0842]|nr:CDK2-associated and cullin domain-containing protein 1 [Chytridiales sp. JEL 0842]
MSTLDPALLQLFGLEGRLPSHSPRNNESEAYYSSHWPSLARFIEVVFSPEKEAVTPLNSFSHEELYRIVYNICLKGNLKKRLYNDLISSVSTWLDLQSESLKHMEHDPLQWFNWFCALMVHNIRARGVVKDIFVYLERSLTRSDPSKSIDIHKTILDLIKLHVIDAVGIHLFQIFHLVSNGSIQVDQDTLSTLCFNLYTVHSDCIAFNPTLFTKLLPNVTIPQNFNDLQAQYARLATAKDMNQIRVEMSSWRRAGPVVKRALPEDEDDDDDDVGQAVGNSGMVKRVALDNGSAVQQQERVIATPVYQQQQRQQRKQ